MSSAPLSTGSRAIGRWHRRRHEVASMVLRRLYFLVLLIFLVTIGLFALAAVSPFDPLDAYMRGNAGELTIAQERQLIEQLGLDLPWYQSWWMWFRNFLHLDLGTSRVYYEPVTQVLAERFPWSALLGALGLSISVLVSFVLGAWAGFHPGGVLDKVISAFSTILQATPLFILALMALGVFSLGLHWAPTGGLSYPGRPITVSATLEHLVLPALVLGISQIPWLVLSLRESIAETLASDAVAGARVRGIPHHRIAFFHALPTALPSFVALVGARLPELIVGCTLVETIFAWPGLGSALTRAAQSLDFALLASLTVGVIFFVTVGNLLADIIFVLLDPRVEADA